MTDDKKLITRREALQGVSAIVGGATLGGCSSDEGGGETPKEQPVDPATALQDIETIVVVIMENRTFDHYLGSLKVVEGREVDGLTGSENNPRLITGELLTVHALAEAWITHPDPPHGWDASHRQFNGQAMDGFVTEYEREASDPSEVMGYHAREKLPVLYALADEYAICDAWFAAVMGPTWPNRFYAHAGTSNGLKQNLPGMDGVPNVWSLLEAAGVPSQYYYGGLPFAALLNNLTGKLMEEFFTDAAAGTLSPVCYVDPTLTALSTIGNDDHPPADIREGQLFLASVYEALAQGPQWDNCLLIITYDEHGGFYDHVAPPTTADEREEFRQLGFRVPSVVVGPRVKKGFRCSTVLEHTSIVSTILRRFGIDAPNERIAASNDVSVVLNGSPSPRSPIVLPQMALPAQARSFQPEHMGGQVELARFIERNYGFDWRAASERSLQQVRNAAVRLGVAQLRTR